MTGSISGLASSIAANLIQFVDAYYFPGGETDLAKHLQGEIDDYYKRAPMADPQELQRQLDIVKEALGNVRFTANEALSEASSRDLPIDVLELTVRAANCLRAEGITTIGELIRYGERRLSHVPHFGRKSMIEVKELLAQRRLALDP